jgi:hypothetical protein
VNHGQKKFVNNDPRLLRLLREKHSSLFALFVSNEENVVITPPGTIFTTLHFLPTYYWTPKNRMLYYTKLERLARENHSYLLGPFVIYKENEVL